MSIHDISAILKEEESKQQKWKNDKRQQQEQELSAKAYELFSEGKDTTLPSSDFPSPRSPIDGSLSILL
jgi:hypothetical protein